MSLLSWVPHSFLQFLTIQAKGRQVWLVGGALRDHFLGRAPLDLDFAVDQDACRLARRFADAMHGKYYQLDAERDAGRVLVEQADGSRRTIDFARLRGEDIQADLRARDFTINALAVDVGDPSTLIDPCAGLQDMKDRLIRACGPQSLGDDPVRILRAVRIATDFDLRIEAGTVRQVVGALGGLERVSAERVRDELMRVLALPRPGKALRVMDHQGVLGVILPELAALKGLAQPAQHEYDAWNHTLAVCDRLSSLLGVLTDVHDPDAPGDLVLAQASLRLGRFRHHLRTHLASELSMGRNLTQILYLAALYHDSGKPECLQQAARGEPAFHGHEVESAEKAAHRARLLRMSGAECERLESIVRHHMRPGWLAQESRLTPRAVYRFFRQLGEAGVDVVLISLADFLGKSAAAPDEGTWIKRLDLAKALLSSYYEERERSVDPIPLLRGSDLISALHLQPGPLVGDLLERIREAQAVGEVDSMESAIALARKWIEQGQDH